MPENGENAALGPSPKEFVTDISFICLAHEELALWCAENTKETVVCQEELAQHLLVWLDRQPPGYHPPAWVGLHFIFP